MYDIRFNGRITRADWEIPPFPTEAGALAFAARLQAGTAGRLFRFRPGAWTVTPRDPRWIAIDKQNDARDARNIARRLGLSRDLNDE